MDRADSKTSCENSVSPVGGNSDGTSNQRAEQPDLCSRHRSDDEGSGSGASRGSPDKAGRFGVGAESNNTDSGNDTNSGSSPKITVFKPATTYRCGDYWIAGLLPQSPFHICSKHSGAVA